LVVGTHCIVVFNIKIVIRVLDIPGYRAILK
jgi:hypothetical protein